MQVYSVATRLLHDAKKETSNRNALHVFHIKICNMNKYLSGWLPLATNYSYTVTGCPVRRHPGKDVLSLCAEIIRRHSLNAFCAVIYPMFLLYLMYV